MESVKQQTGVLPETKTTKIATLNYGIIFDNYWFEHQDEVKGLVSQYWP